MNENYKDNVYDVIVIGGGAAGMMAAIQLRRNFPDYKILILDRTFALGRKILVCGAGRCNVTNVNLALDKYYGDKALAEKILGQFGLEGIEGFFADLGIELYVERKTDIGKMFPTTNQAQTVNAVLEAELRISQIEVNLNHEVVGVKKDADRFLLEANEIDRSSNIIATKQFNCKYLILSAGGKTYPALGANGSGYSLAESFGHKLVTPVPSALPLEVDHPLIKAAAGIRHDCEVWSYIGVDPSANRGNELRFHKTDIDEMMFTPYGLSGPVILNLSREISIRINREQKHDCYLKINFFPNLDMNQTKRLFTTKWEKRPDLSLLESLYGMLPNKLAGIIIQYARLDANKKVSALSSQEIYQLLQICCSWIVKVNATRTWSEAEFTAGGIDTVDVDDNLQSKIVPNLFFAGEILNVDGDVGGFNLSWAWSSGYIAGKLANASNL